MTSLDLEEKYINFIKETVSSVLPGCEIFIYGSRTQGKAGKYSDVDIALKDSTEVQFEKLLNIKAIFHNSTFPYKVDVVDLRTLNENFYKIIEKDLYKVK